MTEPELCFTPAVELVSRLRRPKLSKSCAGGVRGFLAPCGGSFHVAWAVLALRRVLK